MKKITSVCIALLSIVSVCSAAATSSTTKAEVSSPCYDSGLTFGLAGYARPLPATNSDVNQSAYYDNTTDNHASHVDYK